jgi:hypothetical protein
MLGLKSECLERMIFFGENSLRKASYGILQLDDKHPEYRCGEWCIPYHAPLWVYELRDLFEVMADCYDRASTLIAEQMPIEHWHKIIGGPTLADAILDRLIHNAHTITLKGESMRKRTGT